MMMKRQISIFYALMALILMAGAPMAAAQQDVQDIKDAAPQQQGTFESVAPLQAESPLTQRDQAAIEGAHQFALSADKTPKLPQILQNYVERGAQAKYLGYFNGLDGWVIIRGGQPEFHYVTRDGGAIVMGILFDKSGSMITGEQLRMLRLTEGASTYKLSNLSGDEGGADMPSQTDAQQAAATQSPPQQQSGAPLSKSEQFYQDVESGNWLRLGDASAPAIYAFIDPTCAHCARFLRDIRPFIDQGAVQVRMLPMGYHADALKMAAYLLAAPAPMEQIYSHIEGDEEALFVSGDISTMGAARNVAILNKWDVMGTPVLTYRAQDGYIRFVRGAPENVAQIVQELKK